VLLGYYFDLFLEWQKNLRMQMEVIYISREYIKYMIYQSTCIYKHIVIYIYTRLYVIWAIKLFITSI